MNDKQASAPQDSSSRLQGMRVVFVDAAIQGLSYLACLGFLVIIWRAFYYTGWTQGTSAILVVSAIGVFAGLMRKRLTLHLKSGVIIAIMWAVGCTGLSEYGLGSAGTSWLIMVCLVGAVILRKRWAIAVIALCILTLIGAAYGHVSGNFTLVADLNEMSSQPSAWVNRILITGGAAVVLSFAVSTYNGSVVSLLEQVSTQRDEIERLATHDQLTGLPLLRLAVDRSEMAINAARRSGHKVALMFIDLDGFKGVNDTFGHEAGDFVLREVAERLKHCVRSVDTAARIGGDEFIVLITDLQDASASGDVASKIIAAVSQPIDYKGQPLHVGASIGIGVFPDHAQDAANLRKAADGAMYVVKKSGKNAYHFAQESKPNRPLAPG